MECDLRGRDGNVSGTLTLKLPLVNLVNNISRGELTYAHRGGVSCDAHWKREGWALMHT